MMISPDGFIMQNKDNPPFKSTHKDEKQEQTQHEQPRRRRQDQQDLVFSSNGKWS